MFNLFPFFFSVMIDFFQNFLNKTHIDFCMKITLKKSIEKVAAKKAVHEYEISLQCSVIDIFIFIGFE